MKIEFAFKFILGILISCSSWFCYYISGIKIKLSILLKLITLYRILPIVCEMVFKGTIKRLKAYVIEKILKF